MKCSVCIVCVRVIFPEGDEELTDEEIHDRDISWLQSADGRVATVSVSADVGGRLGGGGS